MLNSLILGLLGLVVFFHLLHTTVRSAVRLGIRDARREKEKNASTSRGPTSANTPRSA